MCEVTKPLFLPRFNRTVSASYTFKGKFNPLFAFPSIRPLNPNRVFLSLPHEHVPILFTINQLTMPRTKVPKSLSPPLI